MELPKKVVVITWASDGIGKEIAFRLAKEYCNLALIARNHERLDTVAQKAKEYGAETVKTYLCDIRKTKELENISKKIISDFSTVDILINNAGIRQKVMQIDDMQENLVDDVIATNLTAVIHLTRLLIPTLRTRSESAIINIISKSWVVPQEWQSVYSASKYGIRWFTEILKVDLQDSNVKVAWVYQSGTNTKMFEKAWETFSTEDFTNPADLADVIAYMLSRPKNIRLHDVRIEK